MHLQKWYFAINENGLLNAFDQVVVAVKSAKRNTSLKPYCLVDNTPLSEEAMRRVAQLGALGVTIIRHRSSFYPVLQAQFRDAMTLYSGHWLRCDIPDIERDDEYVFYSDIDVIFLRDPASIQWRPSILACAPEHVEDDFSYFNSGVMIMNLPALRATADRLRGTVLDRLTTMAAHDDQGALNACYAGQWDRLTNCWNWKPYWGVNENAGVLHFHGPKPKDVRKMLNGVVEGPVQDYEIIFNRNPAGYRHWLRVFESFES